MELLVEFSRAISSKLTILHLLHKLLTLDRYHLGVLEQPKYCIVPWLTRRIRIVQPVFQFADPRLSKLVELDILTVEEVLGNEKVDRKSFSFRKGSV